MVGSWGFRLVEGRRSANTKFLGSPHSGGFGAVSSGGVPRKKTKKNGKENEHNIVAASVARSHAPRLLVFGIRLREIRSCL